MSSTAPVAPLPPSEIGLAPYPALGAWETHRRMVREEMRGLRLVLRSYQVASAVLLLVCLYAVGIAMDAERRAARLLPAVPPPTPEMVNRAGWEVWQRGRAREARALYFCRHPEKAAEAKREGFLIVLPATKRL